MHVTLGDTAIRVTSWKLKHNVKCFKSFRMIRNKHSNNFDHAGINV